MKRLLALAVVTVLLGSGSAAAGPLPSPTDFRATGGSFDLSAPCRVRASVVVDDGRVPDTDPRSRVTVYHQMDDQPTDAGGSLVGDAWATWEQPASRRSGGVAEVELYRQDVNPLVFARGYVGPARRWEGVAATPSDVPPTNLAYRVWTYGFRTYAGGTVREDWRVLDAGSSSASPAGSTANLVGTVRKTDRPAMPLPTTVRAGTGTSPDAGLLRWTGSDGVARAWTREQTVTFGVTALDSICPSSLVTDPAQRDASTLPSCEPDRTTFVRCWDHAVAADGSPPGHLDHHADGVLGPSPYCSHLAGQTIPYRLAGRADCPPKQTLSHHQAAGWLPGWWCTGLTAFGFCAESQVDWIGARQRQTWVQLRDLSNGGEAHRRLDRWYGDPQGNTSRNECPRLADGSADRRAPRTCFYEGWWEGEITTGLGHDGPHPLEVEVVDETFRSWLAGAPLHLQNRNGARHTIHRDRLGPVVGGPLRVDDDAAGARFVAPGITDPGGPEAGIGVNPDDVWLYACRAGSLGCEDEIPEGGAGPDRLSMRLRSTGGADFAAVVTGLAPGEWRWKVVSHDLLGNRGEAAADLVGFVAARALPADDTATVPRGATVDVDIAGNDVFGPMGAVATYAVVAGPSHGTAGLVERSGLPPLLRFASNPGTSATEDRMAYRLCASVQGDTDCTDATVSVAVTDPTLPRRPT